MTLDEMYTHGKPIVEQVARDFFLRNRGRYLQQGIDQKDIEQHLYELMYSRYAPLVEERPEYYEPISSFEKSFFVACRKSMFSHVKKHITSQCRGNILRNNAAVHLDEPNPVTGQCRGLTGEGTSYLTKVREITDSCQDQLVQRIIFLLAMGKYSGKMQIHKRLGISMRKLNVIWQEVQEAMDGFDFSPLEAPQLHD